MSTPLFPILAEALAATDIDEKLALTAALLARWQSAHNRPADHDAGAGCHALHRPPEPELADIFGEQAAG